MTTAAPFDPNATWLALEERAKKETDPRRRQLVEQVAQHMRVEIGGDLERLMATLTDDPIYHLWGLPTEAGPKGRAEVRAFYEQMISTGGNHFQFDIRRIVVDEDCVVTEGRMRTPVPGAAVLASGRTEVEGEPVDPEAMYLAESQILTVWPAMPDGRLLGEDIYLGSPMLAEVSRL